MKKLIFLLIALLLCVSCQQPSDNTPPVKTGIELKSGTRYCVEVGSTETSPAILVKYSDGSSVEAMGSFDSSKSGFADITYENFKIENGAYIYDKALNELPSTMGEEYNSKYVLLKAKEEGHQVSKDVYDKISLEQALLITAENLYILGEYGAEIKIDLINKTNVVKATAGSVTLDGIKFSINEGDSGDNEVNIIIADGGDVFIKNCDFTGYNVYSYLPPHKGNGQIGIYSQSDKGLISMTYNTFKELYIVDSSPKTDIIKNNTFMNAYIALFDSNNIVGGNVFNNTSMEYGILNYDRAINEDAVAKLEADNKNCIVVPWTE